MISKITCLPKEINKVTGKTLEYNYIYYEEIKCSRYQKNS